MMPVISIENLWKEYQLGVIGHGTLTHDLQSWWAKFRGKEDPNAKINSLFEGQKSQVIGDRFYALRNINLEVKKGEVLGIIGKNGAGKSTLLKILSRITAPTKGTIRVKGKIGSLLEVGTGFHPELTGRENIFLNGTILGMSKLEVIGKLDEIIEFSGVEHYIDTPAKRYSSGMRVRLAFAVAAHLETEILVVDEVLAVGDAEFQKKAIGKMESVSKGEGRTILFVSHNMSALQKLCPKAILMDKGRVIEIGNSTEVVQHYLGTKTRYGGMRTWQWKDDEMTGLGAFVPLSLKIVAFNGEVSERISSTEPFHVELEYEIMERVSNLNIRITLSTGSNERFCVVWNDEDTDRIPGTYVSSCHFPPNWFSHGGFVLGVISTIPGVMQTFRDYDVLKFYFDASSTLSDLGRAILRPKLPWETVAMN